MKKVFSLLFLIIIISGCGNKENATGGPVDTENPQIITIYPPEFSNIADKNLEITFSKPMDSGSFTTGLYIYPEISAKRYRWDKNTLIIQIQEKLIDNTNYFFSFTKKIKCYHDNELDKQYDFIWANGKLNDYKISGSFSFEEIEDSSEEVRLTLFAADTTLINTNYFTTNFSFEGLNSAGHFIRAFIDKNSNKRLDVTSEPFAEAVVMPKPVSTIDLFLAYSDSTAPVLKNASPRYIDEFDLEFDEEPVKLETVHLLSDSLKTALRIRRWRIMENIVKVFTANMDTIDYQVLVTGAEDKKGNSSIIDSLVFSAITKIDSIPPKVIKISPRDGSSVNSIRPEITITFDEVIFKENAKAWLTELETGLKYPLKAMQGDNEVFIFEPLTDLKNFNSYRIHLEAQDPRGNKLTDFEGSVFLAISSEDIEE